MPKAEKGSLKDLGKRIKAKGLQKLKFYCQMCEKQCRDANGFKCHLTSETHLRQMKIFSEHSGSFLDRYSKEFEKMYLDTLRMRHSTTKVNANNVYQEVIQDKFHIHMNATIWASLSDFCKYLGKTGKCVVEETERGWYVSYVERDVHKLQRDENQQRRQAAERAAEQAAQQSMEQQRVQAAQALDRAGGGGIDVAVATPLERGSAEEETKIQLTLRQSKEKKKAKRSTSGVGVKLGKSVFGDDGSSENEDDNRDGEHASATKVEKEERPKYPTESQSSRVQKRPHLSEEAVKPQPLEKIPESRKRSRKDQTTSSSAKIEKELSESDAPWLYRDIVVRVINKKLVDGRYYRHRAVVDKVIDDFTAEVSVLGEDGDGDRDIAGHVLRLDQDDLETVAPKQLDQKVRIVRGEYRGKKAVPVALDRKKYKASLKLKDGTVLERVDFDDFSLVA